MSLRTLTVLLLGVLLAAGALAGPRTPPAPSAAAGGTVGDLAIPSSDRLNTIPARMPEAGADAVTGVSGEEVEAPRIRARLQHRFEEVVAQPVVEEAGVAISVRDSEGRPLLDVRGEESLIPASTQKLVTAAAALFALGPDHQYTTTVQTTTPVDSDGTVHGDLVIVGSGDPSLSSPTYTTRIYPSRPHTPIEDLADQIADSGVRRITGRVLGDPTIFPDQPRADGWVDRYFHQLAATYVSGLTVDGGRRMFERNGDLVAAVAEEPAETAATLLTELLEERDVAVDGEPAATDDPPPTDSELARVTSPELQVLLRHMVMESDNHIADAIHRTVGLVTTGRGSWRGAAAGTREVLAPLELDWSGTVLADGSGLSREDRLTAQLLTELDAAMSASSHAEEWEDLMAVAGESGTLSGRLVDTLAERRMRGKTGTLMDVRALAGAVDGPDGRYYFAVVGNDLESHEVQGVRRLQDLLTLALAEDLHNCFRVPSHVQHPLSVLGPAVAVLTGPLDADTPYTLYCPTAS